LVENLAVILQAYDGLMRPVRRSKEVEAKSSVMAWAEARGIPAREEHGWIIMDMSDEDPDPVLKVMREVLKDQRGAGS